MKKVILSITVVFVLILSAGVLCSCGVTECENCLGTGYVECPECDGLGQVESEDLCYNCGGSGVVSYGFYDGVCSICNGTGYEDETEICPECNGTGEVICEVCNGQGEY